MSTEREKLVEVLTGVHDFYGRDMSDFAAQVWMQAVKTYGAERVTKALSAHLMDPERGQFMPKPADIVRVLDGTQTDRALIAWGKTFDAMSGVGAYRSVAFDDPAIHCAIEDLGGWPSLCRASTEELPFVQRRFCDSHRAHTARKTPHPQRLIGASEQDNHGKRMTAEQTLWLEQQTVLIGQRETARAVMVAGSAQRRALTSAISDCMPAFAQIGAAA